MNEKHSQLNELPKGQFLVYQREDGSLKLEVRLEDETVWLSQKLLAELFQKDIRTISEHIQNIYEEDELDPGSTIRNFRIVQMEGKREVARMVDFYNLDMIIPVGYRVKSYVATRFRIWASCGNHPFPGRFQQTEYGADQLPGDQSPQTGCGHCQKLPG